MLVLTCIALAAGPWLVHLRARVGGLAALALVTLGVPSLLIAVMIGARTTGAPLTAALEIVTLILGAAGWTGMLLTWRASRRTGASPMQGTERWREVLPGALGALVALCTFLISPLVPGASRTAWAMLGDSASQLEYARLILDEGGLTPPPMRNPVPLTPAIVAASAGPGRPSTGAGTILAHDLSAYTAAWSALIVMTCVLAGAVGYAVVQRSPLLTDLPARVTVAATSLLPLSWFWTGYPIKFGFINSTAIFVVLLASVAGYFGTLKRPFLGMAVQLLAIMLALLTWSPLAVMPAALAAIHALGALRSFGRWPMTARVAGVTLVGLGIAGALWIGIPMLLDARGSLSVPGGLAEFPKLMLPAAAVLLVALTLAASARFDRAAVGVVVLAVAALGGLALVVVLSGTVTGPWTYYPHKYAWTAAAVLLVIGLPQSAVAASRLRGRALRTTVFGGGILAVAMSLGLGSWWAPGYLSLMRDSLPYLILVEDNLPDEGQPSDVVADEVIARMDLERLTIPWQSSLANDYRISFWLIHLQIEEAEGRGDGDAARALWTLANFHTTADDLCAVAAVVPQGVTVQTANISLASELEALCPRADILVEVDPAGT